MYAWGLWSVLRFVKTFPLFVYLVYKPTITVLDLAIFSKVMLLNQKMAQYSTHLTMYDECNNIDPKTYQKLNFPESSLRTFFGNFLPKIADFLEFFSLFSLNVKTLYCNFHNWIPGGHWTIL